MLWSRYCLISEISRTSKAVGNPPTQQMAAQKISATFQINNAKDYVPVVNLPINDNINFIEKIKQGFEITISWNKHRSEQHNRQTII